jgi:hypothetical protein
MSDWENGRTKDVEGKEAECGGVGLCEARVVDDGV